MTPGQALTPERKSSWTAIIEVVKTPLAFLVLGFLIVDGTVAGLALKLDAYRAPLVWTVILAIPFFVLVVTGLAIWKPEALRGERALEEIFANQFASDLFHGLDGALRNLEPGERVEAWAVVAKQITAEGNVDTTYARFSAAAAAKLKKLANVPTDTGEPRGPVKP